MIIREYNSVRKYWGYEFFPDEVNLPSEFGGWTSLSWLWHNECFTLPHIKNGPISKMYRAFLAESVQFPKTKLKKFSVENYMDASCLKRHKVSKQQRILAPFADFILGNTRGIADQINESLSYRRNEGLLWKEYQELRIKTFQTATGRSSLEELWNLVVTTNNHQVYALPEEFIEELDWGGYTLENMKTFLPYANELDFNIYDEIYIESKFLSSPNEMTKDEWLRLLLRSTWSHRIRSLYSYETTRDVILDSRLCQYEINYLPAQAYYLDTLGGIPTKISESIIIPNRSKDIGIPDEVIDYLYLGIRIYPIGLHVEEIGKLEKLATKFNIPILNLYTIITIVLEDLPDDHKIEIDDTEWNIVDAIKIVEKDLTDEYDPELEWVLNFSSNPTKVEGVDIERTEFKDLDLSILDQFEDIPEEILEFEYIIEESDEIWFPGDYDTDIT